MTVKQETYIRRLTNTQSSPLHICHMGSKCPLFMQGYICVWVTVFYRCMHACKWILLFALLVSFQILQWHSYHIYRRLGMSLFYYTVSSHTHTFFHSEKPHQAKDSCKALGMWYHKGHVDFEQTEKNTCVWKKHIEDVVGCWEGRQLVRKKILKQIKHLS